jgi:hypothetical protein
MESIFLGNFLLFLIIFTFTFTSTWVSYFFVTLTVDFILLPLFWAPLLPEQVSDVDVEEWEREGGGGWWRGQASPLSVTRIEVCYWLWKNTPGSEWLEKWGGGGDRGWLTSVVDTPSSSSAFYWLSWLVYIR